MDWITAFKHIPWNKVLSATPSIVESGQKLWNSVASRQRRAATEDVPAAGQESKSEIEIRLVTLDRRVKQLQEESAASFDVVRSITEQHSQLAEQQAQLVQAIDILLARTRLLLWLCGALALGVVGLLVAVLSR